MDQDDSPPAICTDSFSTNWAPAVCPHLAGQQGTRGKWNKVLTLRPYYTEQSSRTSQNALLPTTSFWLKGKTLENLQFYPIFFFSNSLTSFIRETHILQNPPWILHTSLIFLTLLSLFPPHSPLLVSCSAVSSFPCYTWILPLPLVYVAQWPVFPSGRWGHSLSTSLFISTLNKSICKSLGVQLIPPRRDSL